MFDLKIKMKAITDRVGDHVASRMSFKIKSDPVDIKYLHKCILFALGNPEKQEAFMNLEGGSDEDEDTENKIGFNTC